VLRTEEVADDEDAVGGGTIGCCVRLPAA
jgi:hypothetical protein